MMLLLVMMMMAVVVMMALVMMVMLVVLVMMVVLVVTMITNTIYWQLRLSWPQQFLTCGRKKVMRPNNWQQSLGNEDDGDDDKKRVQVDALEILCNTL